MHHFLSSLLLGLLLSAPATAYTVSFSELPQRVRSLHPELRAARLLIQEAQGRQLGSGRWANPTLAADWRTESRVSPVTTTFSLEQSFPLTSRLKLEKQLSAQLITAAQWEVAEQERRILSEAQQHAIRAHFLQQQLTLRKEQLQLATQLADFATGRAKAGEISALDASQTQVEAQRLRLDLQRLDLEHQLLLSQLKPYLDLKPQEPLTLTGSLPTMQQPSGTAQQQRPDLALAQQKVLAAQTELEIAKASRWQDATAGIVGGPESQQTSSGRQNTGFVGLRISLPLPLWNKNQGQISEKAASLQRSQLQAAALKKSILHEVSTAQAEMRSYAALAQQTRETLLPLVSQQSQNLQKAFTSGQSDLLSVLRTRDQHLLLQASALDAERDYHLARIRYESALGQHSSATAEGLSTARQ